jgi:DNA-binding Lrp family transcriptional regulator
MTVSAYVLIQTEVGKAADVAREIAAIPGVVAADDVTGPYDVIARAEAPSMDELGRMVVARWSTSDDGGARPQLCRIIARMPRPIRNSPPPP